ncbi:four helix bundle protein [Bacteroidota bacterium]
MDLSKLKLIGETDQVSDIIWNEVRQWDYFTRDTIGKQLVRAADSVSANLSEAYGRYTIPERIRFIYYSRGSLCETINWIQKAMRRELIATDIGNKTISDLNKISIKLNKYLNSLKAMK